MKDSFNLFTYLDEDWSHLSSFSSNLSRHRKWRHFFHVRFTHIVFIRLAYYFTIKKLPFLGKFFSAINYFLFNIEVPPSLYIDKGLIIPHPSGVVLGANYIGSFAIIFQDVTLGATQLDLDNDLSKRPTIADHVIIGAGSRVLGGITVNSSSKIGANAVVLKDVPSNSIVVGVPARIIT